MCSLFTCSRGPSESSPMNATRRAPPMARTKIGTGSAVSEVQWVRCGTCTLPPMFLPSSNSSTRLRLKGRFIRCPIIRSMTSASTSTHRCANGCGSNVGCAAGGSLSGKARQSSSRRAVRTRCSTCVRLLRWQRISCLPSMWLAASSLQRTFAGCRLNTLGMRTLSVSKLHSFMESHTLFPCLARRCRANRLMKGCICSRRSRASHPMKCWIRSRAAAT
mmetsp:Transcript_65850/g.109451  ORF Transcript_65850/g.109451 Transcript_65850/m.109451 type:complete len:219 (-) Transcript_65850:490-1146(-)